MVVKLVGNDHYTCDIAIDAESMLDDIIEQIWRRGYIGTYWLAESASSALLTLRTANPDCLPCVTKCHLGDYRVTATLHGFTLIAIRDGVPYGEVTYQITAEWD